MSFRFTLFRLAILPIPERNSIRSTDEERGWGGIRRLASRSGLGRYALYLLLAITGPGVLAQNASLLGKIQGGELIG